MEVGDFPSFLSILLLAASGFHQVEPFSLIEQPTQNICDNTSITLPVYSAITLTSYDNTTDTNTTKQCILDIRKELPDNRTLLTVSWEITTDLQSGQHCQAWVQFDEKPRICQSDMYFTVSNALRMNASITPNGLTLVIKVAPVSTLDTQPQRIAAIEGTGFGYILSPGIALNPGEASYYQAVLNTDPYQSVTIILEYANFDSNAEEPCDLKSRQYLDVRSLGWQSEVICSSVRRKTLVKAMSSWKQRTKVTLSQNATVVAVNQTSEPPAVLISYKINGCPSSIFQHGSIQRQTKDSLNHFTLQCDEGYILPPDDIGNITCNATTNSWNRHPLCAAKDCGLPIDIDIHGTLRYGNTTYGSKANLECVTGYTLTESSMEPTVCKADGNWSQLTQRCEEVVCGVAPTSFNNDTMVLKYMNGSMYGDRALVTCKPGYRDNSTSSMTLSSLSYKCDDTGDWATINDLNNAVNSHHQPFLDCQKFRCEEVAGVQRGTNSSSHNDTDIVCTTDFTRQSNRSVSCLHNGEVRLYPMCEKMTAVVVKAKCGEKWYGIDLPCDMKDRMLGLTGIVVGSVVLVLGVLAAIITAIIREKRKGILENLNPTEKNQSMKSIQSRFKNKRSSTDSTEMDQISNHSTMNTYTNPRPQKGPPKPERSVKVKGNKSIKDANDSAADTSEEYVEVLEVQEESTLDPVGRPDKSVADEETQQGSISKRPRLRRQKPSFYEPTSVPRKVDSALKYNDEDHTYEALKRLSQIPQTKTENQYGLLEDPATLAPVIDTDESDSPKKAKTNAETTEAKKRSRLAVSGDYSVGCYTYIEDDLDLLVPPWQRQADTIESVHSEASTTGRSYTYIDIESDSIPPQVVNEQHGEVNHAYDDVCDEETYAQLRKPKKEDNIDQQVYEMVVVDENQ